MRISVESYDARPERCVKIKVSDGDYRRTIIRSVDSFGFADLSYLDLDDLLLLTERAYEAGKSGKEFKLTFKEYTEDGELYDEY